MVVLIFLQVDILFSIVLQVAPHQLIVIMVQIIAIHLGLVVLPLNMDSTK